MTFKTGPFLTVLMTSAVGLSASSALAQQYGGRYVMSTGAGSAVLELTAEGDGQYAGSLTNAGFSVPVSALEIDGLLQGSLEDGTDSVVFFADVQDNLLTMTLFEVGVFGQPVQESAEVLVFQSVQAGAQLSSAEEGEDNVTINGAVLSEVQRAQLAAQYGVAPLPGDYWYDSRSGLYGVIGYQAFGFMLPGHDFGTPARSVSAGDTGVIVNGRELPQSEWLIWSYMLGAPILVGSYWLDEQGNAGYEGVDLPIVNLYVAAQQNAYSAEGGGGGGGDNFWTSRFSAGNYDSDNSRGYVSVPGYGPVGYGF